MKQINQKHAKHNVECLDQISNKSNFEDYENQLIHKIDDVYEAVLKIEQKIDEYEKKHKQKLNKK